MKLTIRIGAARDEVEIDGHVFDRSKLTRSQKRTMAAMVRDTLVADGTITNVRREGNRKRRRRK